MEEGGKTLLHTTLKPILSHGTDRKGKLGVPTI